MFICMCEFFPRKNAEYNNIRFKTYVLSHRQVHFIRLTYVIKSYPVTRVHLLFNVPEDYEVLGLSQRVLVHAGGQAGAALRSHQVRVAVGPLEGHVLWHGAPGCEALEILWAQCVAHLRISTSHKKQVLPGWASHPVCLSEVGFLQNCKRQTSTKHGCYNARN